MIRFVCFQIMLIDSTLLEQPDGSDDAVTNGELFAFRLLAHLTLRFTVRLHA